MNEVTWLACDSPTQMLESQGRKMSSRKLTLFAIWCCRSVWRQMRRRRSRRHVEVAERYVEGLAGTEELLAAYESATAAFEEAPENTVERHVALVASVVVVNDADEAASIAEYVAGVVAHHTVYPDDSVETTEETEAAFVDVEESARATQAGALRCIVGNPFRRVRLAPDWRTPTVLSVAQAAHDERVLPRGELDTLRLAILADALEDAGCAAPEILSHLRSPGPHPRGCWPVDLILGKR